MTLIRIEFFPVTLQYCVRAANYLKNVYYLLNLVQAACSACATCWMYDISCVQQQFSGIFPMCM